MSCTAVIKPLSEVENLEALWTDFEHRASRPVFLSWKWLDVAACHGADQIFVVLISDNMGELVGLGWFCALEEVRHNIMRVTQLRLHEVGEDGAATVPPEFNSLMTLEGYETEAWEAVLSAVLSSEECPRWDEIILTNAYMEVKDFFATQKLRTHLRAEYMSAFVDLEKLRVGGAVGIDGYLAQLSRNTRSQIRRSIKLYEERGPITLERASTPREAQDYLTTLATMHENKWRARGRPGLISNEQYLAFNRTMIDRHFNSGVIELLIVRAGQEDIGLVCNFVDRSRVLFNVGAFAPSTDNRKKPGLVTQALAIVDHMDRGNIVYDFMAGNDRYKYSLGERGPDMIQFAIQKPKTAIMMETAARFAKQKLISLSRVGRASGKGSENAL